MKNFFLIVVFFPIGLFSMEPILVDQTRQIVQSDNSACLLPKDVCAKIAVYKTMGYPIIAVCDRTYPAYINGWPETLCLSSSWLKTRVPNKDLMENQVWFSQKNNGLLFRYDNDETNDCNEFNVPRLGDNQIVCYDGPNNERDTKDSIEGARNGVIVVGHSYLMPNGVWSSQFYLFKQHGVSAKEYTGPQQKIKTTRAHGYALKYEEFPYQSTPLRGHKICTVALASRDKIAVLTENESKDFHLNVYAYDFTPNTIDPTKPDQSFTTQLIAHAQNMPNFKHLAWLYGKTLIGLTADGKLYTMAVDGKSGTIRLFLQKTDRPFKDFALGRPYSQHEMVLVDEKNELYYANLKYHDPHGRGFLYKKIVDLAASRTRKKNKSGQTRAKISKSSIERVWIDNDAVGLQQADPASPIKFPMMGWLMHATGYFNFLELRQKSVSVESVAQELKKLGNPRLKAIAHALSGTEEIGKAVEKKKRRKK